MVVDYHFNNCICLILANFSTCCKFWPEMTELFGNVEMHTFSRGVKFMGFFSIIFLYKINDIIIILWGHLELGLRTEQDRLGRRKEGYIGFICNLLYLCGHWVLSFFSLESCFCFVSVPAFIVFHFYYYCNVCFVSFSVFYEANRTQTFQIQFITGIYSLSFLVNFQYIVLDFIVF